MAFLLPQRVVSRVCWRAKESPALPPGATIAPPTAEVKRAGRTRSEFEWLSAPSARRRAPTRIARIDDFGSRQEFCAVSLRRVQHHLLELGGLAEGVRRAGHFGSHQARRSGVIRHNARLMARTYGERPFVLGVQFGALLERSATLAPRDNPLARPGMATASAPSAITRE